MIEKLFIHQIVTLIGISVVPSILLTIFNILLFFQLKTIDDSRIFDENVNTTLRKSIFQAKMSMIITMNLVCSQIIISIGEGYKVRII